MKSIFYITCFYRRWEKANMSNIFSDEIIFMDKLDVGKYFGEIDKTKDHYLENQGILRISKKNDVM